MPKKQNRRKFEQEEKNTGDQTMTGKKKPVKKTARTATVSKGKVRSKTKIQAQPRATAPQKTAKATKVRSKTTSLTKQAPKSESRTKKGVITRRSVVALSTGKNAKNKKSTKSSKPTPPLPKRRTGRTKVEKLVDALPVDLSVVFNSTIADLGLEIAKGMANPNRKSKLSERFNRPFISPEHITGWYCNWRFDDPNLKSAIPVSRLWWCWHIQAVA